jgi:hypothetical protein
MDNRLLTFASIYKEAAGTPVVPVEPVVRPGMGARIMEGLSGAAGRVGVGLQEAGAAAGRGLRAITEVPANVRALAEPQVNTEMVLDPVTREYAPKTTATQAARVHYDANTKSIVGANTPEEIAALKTEGFSDYQIQQARNLAMRNYYEGIRSARAAQRQANRQQAIDQGKAMFTKGFSGTHLQARLATMSPAGKAGMLVMTGLSVWYYLFSGKKPQANTEDGQSILMDVPPTESIVPGIITGIDAVIDISNQLSKPDVATSLNTVKTALNVLQGSSLTIDDPSSSQVFVQNVKNAEAAVNAALPQLETLNPTQPDDLQKVQNLKGLFGDFMVDVIDVRGMQA